MPKRTFRVGDGITERAKTTFVLNGAGLDEIRSHFKRHNDAITRPWGHQSEIIAAIRQAYEAVKQSEPDIMQDVEGYNTYYKERSSEPWYLQTLVVYADIVETALQEGRPWEAVSESLIMGELLTELRMKHRWEPTVLKAEDTRARQEDAAAQRRGRPRADRIADVKALIAAGEKVTAAFRIVADREGCDWKAIEKDYYLKPKKRPTTSE